MQFFVLALASLAVATPVFQREASSSLTLRSDDYSYPPSYGGGNSGGGNGGGNTGGGNGGNGGGNNGGGNGGNGGGNNGGGNGGNGGNGGSGGSPFDACSGLMDTPQCCATDVLGVACLDSSNGT